jgi:hypothetical protein
MTDVNKHFGNPDPSIDNPSWKCVMIDPDGITVEWSEKYGPQKAVDCIGLWKSSDGKQWMLTWKDGQKQFVENSNECDLKVSRRKPC